jgi:hypothetical protein
MPPPESATLTTDVEPMAEPAGAAATAGAGAGTTATADAGTAATADAAPAREPATPAATDDGLPRRRRQANLPRQLSAVPGEPAPAPAPTPADDEPAVRSPEDVRALMASLQAGTVRGRRDAAELPREPGAPPDPATDAGRREAQ